LTHSRNGIDSVTKLDIENIDLDESTEESPPKLKKTKSGLIFKTPLGKSDDDINELASMTFGPAFKKN